MRAEDLNHKELLELDADGGVIRFAGQRALLLDAVAMGLLRKYLVDNFGVTATRAVLTQFGFAHGWRIAEAMETDFSGESTDGRLLAGLRLLALEGLFLLAPASQTPLSAAGSMIVASYEAEQHLLHFGPSDAPVCWTICGLTSGYISRITGKEIYVLEDRCMSKGDAGCHLLGRTREEWGEQRAEELEERSTQLASFQVGMLSALLRTLDLRDQMTARNSAAVARYARAIAERAGLSRREQELVHIAGLLHDIGKFILPDRILKADVALGEEDWMLIRRHPQQGARVVGAVDGYGPVAEIILAHHERVDGGGYPRGLIGDEIPALARIISVADTFDVMTSRDSYRVPVTAAEAIQELRRVAGTQLDPRFVEIFAELMQGRDITFQHGEDADFEKELALESRIEAFAMPRDQRGSRQAAYG